MKLKDIAAAGVVICLAAIYGCADQGAIIRKQSALRGSIPECHTEKHCDLMWSASRQWVLSNAGRKLQHITDDYMETYNPAPNSPLIAVRVNKEALPDGRGTRMVVTVWCDNIFGCQPNQWDAALSFNRTVSAIKEPLEDTENLPSEPLDLHSEITKLDDLRKKGLLTDEEFKAEKAKLLAHD